MRNSNFSEVGTPSKKSQPIINPAKMFVEISPVNVAGKRNSLTPRQFTGCVSELSYRAQDLHQYGSALKNYAETCRRYQAYLAPDDPVSAHDYSLTVAETEEHGLLGLLGDDIEQSMRSHVHFSDDEIEQCGYLGWLQH